MRAEGYTASEVFGFSLYVQFTPACACGDDYRRGCKRFSATGENLFLFALKLCSFNLPVFKNLYRVMFYVCRPNAEAGLPDYAEVQPIFAFPVCKNIAFFSSRTKNPIERFYGPIDKIYTST